MNMEIVMIKKHGCGPCKMYEPRIKEVAIKNNLEFRTIQAEEMPKKFDQNISLISIYEKIMKS